MKERPTAIRSYFGLRQPMSGLSHLVGVFLSLGGMIWLVRLSLAQRTRWHAVSFGIFGVSMALLYLSSTLYHLLPLSEKGTQRLRRVDHIMIYVFIAGSYTPMCLIALRDGWGRRIFAGVWAIAVIGAVLKLLPIGNNRWLRVVPYLAMSWISILILPQLWQRLHGGGMLWLAAGGLAYTGGAAIYALRWPDPIPHIFGFHEIWHLLVLLGSFCHFWMMRSYVFYL